MLPFCENRPTRSVAHGARRQKAEHEAPGRTALCIRVAGPAKWQTHRQSHRRSLPGVKSVSMSLLVGHRRGAP